MRRWKELDILIEKSSIGFKIEQNHIKLCPVEKKGGLEFVRKAVKTARAPFVLACAILIHEHSLRSPIEVKL